jgi:hypothetical protein
MEQEINGKVQKINDEDYEIIKVIEKETYPGAVRWYKDTYSCDLAEAVKGIEAIKKKYNVDHVGLYTDLDIEDLVFMCDLYRLVGAEHKINRAELISDFYKMEPEDWIMSKTGWSKDEAYNTFITSYEEWERRNPDKVHKGCVITLLIAITSSLSIGSLIAYCI